MRMEMKWKWTGEVKMMGRKGEEECEKDSMEYIDPKRQKFRGTII